MGRLIELNADVGEGGPDAQVVPHVQRVSIACGGHVGDADSMRAALLLAGKHGVMPGAHPSYPDPANFGRAVMPARAADITRWVVDQTMALQAVAEALGMRLFHVKPHGALYNRSAHDELTARAVIEALLELEGLALVALAESPLADWARAEGISVLEEAYADRRYLKSGRLAPRNQPGAVIQEPENAVAQGRAIALGQYISTADGDRLKLRADTLCLHGEGERAPELARLLAQNLLDPK